MGAYKYFFSLFNAPKDKVLKVVKSLTEEERRLLVKKYGEDFNNTQKVYSLTKKEEKIINERIIRKIKLRLKKIEEDMCLISIEEIFLNEDLKEIKRTMKETKLLKYFQKLFGKELDCFCYDYKQKDKSNINEYYVERVKKRILKNKGISKIKIIKPFSEMFVKYKKQEETYEEFENRLKNIVREIKDKYKKIIYQIYGEELNNIILKHPVETEERKTFTTAYSIIIKKLQIEIRKAKPHKIPKYKPILTLFDEGTTLEEVIDVLKTNENIYTLSKKKYGEDLNMPAEVRTLTVQENHQLYEFYYKVRGIIFREKKIKALIFAKNMYDCPLHKAFGEIYGYNLAYALIIYINFYKYISIKEISEMSESNMGDVLETIEKYEENNFSKTREIYKNENRFKRV
ncbi:MAG: hypothetical protein HFE04_03585 [Bacilli bacterium]|nr:hypothetical protein [Bacilli bacterium]